MLTRIERLREHGVFLDFAWPGELADFDRFNLIYGWNGTGKTTLGRLLRAVERRSPPAPGDVVLQFGPTTLRPEEFAQAAIPIRVFNRDFVADSVFPVTGGPVPPIYVLGPESVGRQREVERLQVDRDAALAALADAQRRSLEATRTLDRLAQDAARTIKEALRSSGSNPYNNYDRQQFRQDADAMATRGDAASLVLTEAEREALLRRTRSSPRPPLPEVEYRFPDVGQWTFEATSLLATTAAGLGLRTLLEDAPLARWIQEGLDLQHARATGTCLYCEQPTPAGRIAALEAHFNAAHRRLLAALDELGSLLTNAQASGSALVLPRPAEFHDDLAAEAEVAIRRLRDSISTADAFAAAVKSRLAAKLERPHEQFALDLEQPVLALDAAGQLNAILRRHNEACSGLEEQIRSARHRVASAMLAEGLPDYLEARDAVADAASQTSDARTELARLSQAIEELEREIVQHRRPADELNRALVGYLGHAELSFSVERTGYLIKRRGEPATSLSEGETTAIALLYFLRSLDDHGFDLTNGIVVLDDPVSSLDQGALFAAFGHIRARVLAAGQVFILTHNFTLFRLVREWFAHLRGPDRRTWRIYMLECMQHGVRRGARLRSIDPLLQDFDSEYHYLFAQLHQIAIGPATPALETYYSAPSIARRVIEMFLAFRVPDVSGSGKLWQQMQTVAFDEARRSRIYRFLQVHAHRDGIGDFDEDLTLLGESRAVMGDVLEFMRSADPQHVQRMIDRVNSTRSAAVD